MRHAAQRDRARRFVLQGRNVSVVGVAHPDQMVTTFDKLVTSRDLAGIGELLDDDAVQRSLDGSIVEGKTAILAGLKELMAANAELHGTPRLSVIAGDLALVASDFEFGVDAPDGTRQHVTATGLNVLRRHADGWRFAIINPRGLM